jgi:hypothetical protein
MVLGSPDIFLDAAGFLYMIGSSVRIPHSGSKVSPTMDRWQRCFLAVASVTAPEPTNGSTRVVNFSLGIKTKSGAQAVSYFLGMVSGAGFRQSAFSLKKP